MRKIKLLLTVMMFAILLTSCEKTEFRVDYGFICSEELFDLVDVTATYTSDKGDELVVNLTPSIMKLQKDDSSEFGNILIWGQSKKYDDKVTPHLTVSFSKKDGVNYTAYKGINLNIKKHAYLDTQMTKSGFSTITFDETNSIDLTIGIGDEIKGDDIESYVNRLVSEPIIK